MATAAAFAFVESERGPGSAHGATETAEATGSQSQNHGHENGENTAKESLKPKKSKCYQADGLYSDPVYKQISLRNGEINKMTKESLKKRLAQHRLDTRGVKEVLKKRLKNFYKKKKLMASHTRPPAVDQQLYDYILVIDFEATCQEYNPRDFKFEIIEFPIVLINVEKMAVEGEFHAYCRPLVNPQLTEFCTKLTGITQETVNGAKPFCEVLAEVEQWRHQRGLGTTHSCAVLTDGPWDMGRFMATQCKLSDMPHPEWAQNWINLRKCYANFYDCKRCSLANMLESLEFEFEGHPHSGIDDARNIARVAIRLLQDGAVLKENEKLITHNQRNEAEQQNEVQRNGKSQPDDLDIQKPMSKLKIKKTKPVRVEEEEEEDVDDILAYYQLWGQKAKSTKH